MQSPIVLVVLGALVVLALAVMLRGRSRRDDSLVPVRLGPSWSPTDDITTPPVAPRDPDALAARVEAVAARTGAERETVVTVLDAWDEYVGVLGLGPLPVHEGRRMYDPYDPPLARRGPDGKPVPDPHRVARDVASRHPVAEGTAREIIAAAVDTVPTTEARTSEG